MTTPWQEYKEKLGTTRPWDAFRTDNKASEQVAADRWAICLECPRLTKVTNLCKECGCYMPLKIKLTAAVCPIGKW